MRLSRLAAAYVPGVSALLRIWKPFVVNEELKKGRGVGWVGELGLPDEGESVVVHLDSSNSSLMHDNAIARFTATTAAIGNRLQGEGIWKGRGSL